MSTVATTKMSSKGQIVIPEEIRNKLGLKSGSKFIVLGEKDVVILKSISPPTMADFDNLIKKARKQSKLAGLKKADIKTFVEQTRANT